MKRRLVRVAALGATLCLTVCGSKEPVTDEQLAKALFNREHSVLKQWLSQVGDPNRYVEFGLPPLSLAASNGDAEAVKILLEAGADPEFKGETDQYPIQNALESRDDGEQGDWDRVLNLLSLPDKKRSKAELTEYFVLEPV